MANNKKQKMTQYEREKIKKEERQHKAEEKRKQKREKDLENMGRIQRFFYAEENQGKIDVAKGVLGWIVVTIASGRVSSLRRSFAFSILKFLIYSAIPTP